MVSERAEQVTPHKPASLPSNAVHFNRSGPVVVLFAILLLGFGLRLHRLGDQNIWWDEGHAIWAARQSLAQVTNITARDVHPPLYLWLLHVWMRLTGESEFSVRYLSLAGGMLTVALAYVVARRLIGRRAALLATLLLATARFHIWWSQEARMYVWATFFGLLSIYYFIRLRQRANTVWWLYVFSSAAALYTLYLSILVLVLENLFTAFTVWRRPRKRRVLFNWGLSQVSILILYAPWFYTALSRTRTDVARTSFPFHAIWQLYGTVLTTGISTDLDRYTWLLVAFGILAVSGIGLLLWDRSQPQRYGFSGREVGLLLLLPLVLPPLVVYGLSIPRGIFYSPKPEARYLLLFAPLFYVLIAGTLASFWPKGRWGQAITGTAIVLVLGTFVSVLPGYYVDRYLSDDYQTAMTTLAAYAQPDDAVLLVSGDRYPVFLYHYHRQFPDGDGPVVYLMPRHNTLFAPENVESELDPLSEQHSRIWLASFERAMQDPENLVEPWLEAHRTSVLEAAQGYNSLRLYTVEDALPPVDLDAYSPPYRLDRVLGEGVLVGYDQPTQEFRPGDLIRPGLYIRAVDGLALAVDWMDDEGQIVEQQVLSVPATGAARYGLRVTPSFAVYDYTAPGCYWLDVYERGTQDHVRIPAGCVTQSRRLPEYKIDRPKDVWMGNGLIHFLGYGTSPEAEIRVGRALTVDLHWQTQRRLETDYTVFVHLLGEYNPATGGPVWAQDDGYPLDSGYPTTRWLPGQVIADRHLLDIPPDTPPGIYEIEVGLYDALTGERLSINGRAEDRILIGTVQIVAR